LSHKLTLAAAAASLSLFAAPCLAAGPSDPQIAHIAYTAGVLDIEAAKLALKKSQNKAVRGFAQEMVRDHEAVNDKALALVKKLGMKPEENATSKGLTEQARLTKLTANAFDRAYAANEVSYHKTVNGALKSTLIPSADNGELKSLLETGLALFTEHQAHAAHLAAQLKK
jgi:putative membrane protein